MSQRTMPSMSPGTRPASSMAASAACVARVRSLRPDSREKSVAPIPTMAQRSRCENASSAIRNRPSRRLEASSSTLSPCARPAGRPLHGRPRRRPRSGTAGPGRGPAGTSSCSTVTKKSLATQVLVVEQVVGGVGDADRQPAGLAVVVGLVGRLQQEEDLDQLLDVAEVLLPVAGVGELRLEQVGRQALGVHPVDERLPWLQVGHEQHEVDVAVVAALEQRRVRGRGLGVPARLPVDDHPRVEPVGVGQLGADREAVVHADVDQLALTGALPRRPAPAAGAMSAKLAGGLVALVAAGPDRRDGVVVVAAAVQRAAERQPDEVGAEAIGPWAVEAERRDRHHHEPSWPARST